MEAPLGSTPTLVGSWGVPSGLELGPVGTPGFLWCLELALVGLGRPCQEWSSLRQKDVAHLLGQQRGKEGGSNVSEPAGLEVHAVV